MTFPRDDAGIALFDKWAPRVLWSWFPGAAMLTGLVANLTQWQVFIWAAWSWFLIHAGVLIVQNWERPWVRPLLDGVVAWFVGLARVASGQQRTYANQYEKISHEDDARQRAVELHLIAEAEANPSEAGGVFLGDARAAQEERLDWLLQQPRLTGAQHKERVQIESWLREDRAAANTLAGVQGFAGPIAQPRGFLGPVSATFGGVQLWIMGGLGALAVFNGAGWWATDLRADRHALERDEAQANAERAIDAIDALREVNREQGELLAATRNQVAETARVIERTRVIERQAALERRRRENAVREIIAGDDSPPPDWGLREPDALPSGAGDHGDGDTGAGPAG